ncbi:af7102b5-66b2-4079-b283-868b21aaec68 [Thermothielavioides terrestris]|uniref:Af7102b5-66b2-4079-b283-868b21aaec68 n=1 Tax=Thermothielavioides terrestris TaxID=2587410 RepID=A0A446BYM5_9PEZI|nr:af7102b5-66b2-4079-b283-868b21aaec68 [Thermothielavioides terrestris]
MSLKKLKSDVATAAKKVAANGIAGIVSVANGDSDGEVVIVYRHESLAADVRIQALAQDLGDYPDGNRFLLWTDESDPAPHVVAAIKAAQDYLVGMSVYEMVSELASRLDKEIRRALDGGGESATEAEQGNDEPAQDDDDYDAAYDSDYPSDGDEFGLPTSAPRGSLFGTTPTELNKPLLQRIRRDLRRVKQAGYKVGLLDGFGKDDTRGVVSLSIRIDKLAISSQALEAWDVNPTEYLVLLLCFVKPYQPLDRILNQPVSQTQVKFHVGKCARYKPSINHARRLFADDCSLALASSTARAKHLDSDSDDFQKLFISNSLEQFLRESFVSLLKLRESRGLGWDEANELLRTSIGLCSEDQGLPEPLQGRDSGCSSPVKVSAPEHHGPLGRDHLMENLPASERSFPLIAMQFVTRYFVDCTKYCLRCHRRLKEDFEALRPYVCADGLCLFQYMAMGLGPAIEHEILTEPYVVDLLVTCALPDQLGAEEDGIVDVFLYDTDFDALSDVDKGIAIRNILDTLPPILDIEDWLADHPYSSIRDMDRISPAAASLLQWIVSSNRSCIFQVDRSREVAGRWRGQIGASAGTLPPAGRGRNREHERILGMDGWVQFRFAQGSPDKELRFNRALQEVAARKHMKENPTIFAWHGSRLSNWHSILRTGLDYRDVTSGRAFGNGVYFSPRSSISTGYAYMGSQWPNSDLKITSCLSLNEIINAPDEFVSCTPHYVVYGQSEKPLKIPLSAIPLRTINRTDAVAPGPAKRTVQRLEESDDEDAEEMAILFSDDKLDTAQDPPKKKSASRASSVVTAEVEDIVATGPPTPASIDHSLTDFVPGSLDLSTLPRLAPPSFATDAGTKSLSRELVRLQNIQATTPLHELGWYMDFDQVSNLYQWIVELHSFDASLPLARDMKKSGIGSIVMEVRFGPDFPFSPPFVRVVRPRFLPFMNGGGGHVTAGGAMCMELLTATGWSPANSMESVFLQVRMALCSTDPQPARLDPAVLQMGKARGLRQAGPWMDYGIAEAIEAFIRAANAHGWTVPANLRVTANGV